MKRFILYLAIMICQLILTEEAQAINYKEKDTTAARLSIEFRRLYIDGDEAKLYAKAQELFDYIKTQPKFDHHLYYSTLLTHPFEEAVTHIPATHIAVDHPDLHTLSRLRAPAPVPSHQGPF